MTEVGMVDSYLTRRGPDCTVKFLGSDGFDHSCQREKDHAGRHWCAEHEIFQAGEYKRGRFVAGEGCKA